MKYYVRSLSTTAYYIKAKDRLWQIRTLKWDPWFEPNIETTLGVAWISLPDLPPNFFAKESIFSITSTVGKPLIVDMATKNHMRPSGARIKVLIAKLAHIVKINKKDDCTGTINSK
ncbi:hypothetical protein FXO37_00601 [Capsicum annuum]|nr:hypothetical protein FXO37_00601 [Capsicum annuum]